MRGLPIIVFAVSCALAWTAYAQSSPETVNGQNVSSSRILVELFTSEACSSCPPADELLRQLDSHQMINGEQIVVLSEHVDYWDGTGWRDRFSSRDYTNRQQEYARRFGISGPYTPQIVVDGRREFVGNDARLLQSALNEAALKQKAEVLVSTEEINATEIAVKIKISSLPHSAKRADLYVALADNIDETHVNGGENSGRVLRHVAAVRSLLRIAKLGEQGIEKEIRLRIPKPGTPQNLRVVAFVQEPDNGAVLGAGVKVLRQQMATQ